MILRSFFKTIPVYTKPNSLLHHKEYLLDEHRFRAIWRGLGIWNEKYGFMTRADRCSLRSTQTSGSKLKDLKHHMKLAGKWLQRLKKTGIEKGTASVNELKALIPEATEIRIDLSEDIRVLKQATCSYCICSRPGEDLGFLVECKKCTEGYHGVCMGITAEQAEVLRASEEGFTCIRCRISSLFTSAEQAMLTAMKRWMPSTCFAEQAGFDETPPADDSGTYASHRSPWFCFLSALDKGLCTRPCTTCFLLLDD